jgi:hypothetical protein
MVYKVPNEVAESVPEYRLRQIMTSGQTWVRGHHPPLDQSPWPPQLAITL